MTHRHYIDSDLYFMSKGQSSREEYHEYKNCAPLCVECHALVTAINSRFRKVYLKGIDAWKIKNRTPEIYAELKAEIGTTVWYRFLKDRASLHTKREGRQLAKFLAHLAIDKRYGGKCQ